MYRIDNADDLKAAIKELKALLARGDIEGVKKLLDDVEREVSKIWKIALEAM